MPKLPEYKAEATPEGVNLLFLNDDNLYEHMVLIGYGDAINEVNSGAYDDYLSDGMRVIEAVFNAEKAGYFLPSDEQRMLMWRWIVTFLFISEQISKHGYIQIEQEDGSKENTPVYVGENGAIPIYPYVERFSLANQVESVAHEHFRDKDPHLKSLLIYQHMVEMDKGALRLSDWGRQGLVMIHEGFINALDSGSLPEMPVCH